MRACLVGRQRSTITAVMPAIPPMSGCIAPPARCRWGDAGYTLIHAGRQLRLGPIAFWVVVGTLVIMAVWTITTATYFAFREDVLTRLIARQAEMQFGYEDRIAELRAQVDRISSRQLLDQEQYRAKARSDSAPAVGVGIACERAERPRRRHRLDQAARAQRHRRRAADSSAQTLADQ